MDILKYKICSSCKKYLPIEDFYKAGTTSKGNIRYSSECRKCRKEREKDRYGVLYEDLSKRKVKCKHCGISKPYLLEFHHRDPKKKEFTIAKWRKKSKEKLLSELNECDTLCKNCHAEFHYLNRKNGISYNEYIKSNSEQSEV